MEEPISDMASVVNEIFTFVLREAQSMEIGEVERHLLSLVMAVGRAALEGFVAVKGTGYAGKEIVDAQGHRCRYVRDRSCAYRSIFETISIRRAYYHAVGSRGIFPLDGELNLPERGHSYLVQDFPSRLAVTMSYEDAAEILGSFFSVRMPIRPLESIVGDVCDEVDRFCQQKALEVPQFVSWAESPPFSATVEPGQPILNLYFEDSKAFGRRGRVIGFSDQTLLLEGDGKRCLPKGIPTHHKDEFSLPERWRPSPPRQQES